MDDAVQGNQTLLCELGDVVQLYYSNDPPKCEDKISTEVGRPSNSTPDNGSNQLKDEIRDLKLAIKVFAKPGSGGMTGAITATQTEIPAVLLNGSPQPTGWIKIENEFIAYTSYQGGSFKGCTRGVDGTTAAAHPQTGLKYSTITPCIDQQTQADLLEIAKQRFAQATVRVVADIFANPAANGAWRGLSLPGVLLDGFTFSNVTDPLTPDELKLVSLKAAGANVVTVFYIEPPFFGPAGAAGVSYPAIYNVAPHSAPGAKNFVVVKGGATGQKPFTLPHELTHVLVNSGHRAGDPDVALLYQVVSETNTVKATKRLGSFPTAGPGSGDTFTIRSSVLSLP